MAKISYSYHWEEKVVGSSVQTEINLEIRSKTHKIVEVWFVWVFVDEISRNNILMWYSKQILGYLHPQSVDCGPNDKKWLKKNSKLIGNGQLIEEGFGRPIFKTNRLFLFISLFLSLSYHFLIRESYYFKLLLL